MAYVIVFAFYAQTRVLREEGRLAKTFGQLYLTYCRAVPRWLPRPVRQPVGQERSVAIALERRRLASCPARFSWSLVLLNHEHRVAAAVAVALAVLTLRVELLPPYFAA